MSSIDTEHRRLCHALFDAIEAGDIDAVERCYTPDMTLWFNATGEVMSREDNLVAEVRDGKISKLFEYLDSGKFGRR